MLTLKDETEYYLKSKQDKSLDLEGLVRASNMTRDNIFKDRLALLSRLEIYIQSDLGNIPCMDVTWQG